jgi:hypothetical protein
MKTYFTMLVFWISFFGFVSSASAAWEEVPISNPGAETGDMTGWNAYSWDIGFTVVNNPSIAYEGSYYFFSRPSQAVSNYVSTSQDVDLSDYTGSILNVEVSAFCKSQSGQRWGYDSDTNTWYLYDWKTWLTVNAYSDSGHLFGITFFLLADDQWHEQTIPLNLRLDWEEKREILSRISIMAKAQYAAVDISSPPSRDIEQWGDWVGDEPTIVAYDAFSVTVETDSTPGGSGLIGDNIQAILIPRTSTSIITPFTSSAVQVVDPGTEFTGELSSSWGGLTPYNYSVAVDIFSDYFTVKIHATNDWLTGTGGQVNAFGVGGDSASIYDIQISDLDLPGGIGPVAFDPSRSIGFIGPSYIREITWDTNLKQVNVRFAWVRNEVTYAFALQAENSPPVANAGADQVMIVGDAIQLQGSATDPDGDSITSWFWTVESAPAGSSASFDDSSSQTPFFTMDLEGEYILSLVVSDGIADSDPATTTIIAMTAQDAAVEELIETTETISELDPDIFLNENMSNALTNKINAAIELIDQGFYEEALIKLQEDILGKTDGCANDGSPDRNDWITDCDVQTEVYPFVLETIELLESLI